MTDAHDGGIEGQSTRIGVGAVFCASHPDHLTGELHGHSYEVTAWFEQKDGLRKDARLLQDHLEEVLRIQFDHKTLPRELAWAEDIAAGILKLCPLGCVQVDVSRPLERIYARVAA